MVTNEIFELVKSHQSEKRLKHTQGVLSTIETLAETYNLDENKCRLAAMLHDITKEMDKDQQLKLIEGKVDQFVIDTPALWHSFSGSYYIQEKGITDQDVIDAIRYHTTGIDTANPVIMALYISDYLEPNRTMAKLDAHRNKVGMLPLHILYNGVAKERIEYELSQGRSLYHLTEELYDKLK